VEKKSIGKIQVCIYFHNLNKATPKDEYPMPIADMLINNACEHRVISFLDGNAGYNKIFMVEEDMSKTLSMVLLIKYVNNALLMLGPWSSCMKTLGGTTTRFESTLASS
jgi:hypothetical protein